MLEQWLIGALLLAGCWLFYDGMRVREIALDAGREYCNNLNLQFLDESVCRQRIGLVRAGDGRLRIRRAFGFEFTSDGERRYHGELTTVGARVVNVNVEIHRILH